MGRGGEGARVGVRVGEGVGVGVGVEVGVSSKSRVGVEWSRVERVEKRRVELSGAERSRVAMKSRAQ